MPCNTNVPNLGPNGEQLPMQFRACGRPTTDSVMVGNRLCHYCAEHAESARRFVARLGNPAISRIQSQVRGS